MDYTTDDSSLSLAFGMTINKAQGQTISKLGLYLPDHVFGHGQLYVALSRATRMSTVKIVAPNSNHQNKVKNIVYHEVLI